VVLLRKFKETSLSVFPIVLIVFLLHITIAPVPWVDFWTFLGGSAIIILGLSLFLYGTDLGIIPTASSIGSALMQRRSLILLLLSGLVMGLFITLAEPQIHVLSTQITSLTDSVQKSHLLIAISFGMGLFLMMALARVIFNISFRYLITAIFTLIFILAYFSERFFIGIAFDSGGAATGPMTVPFILALGVGVASVRKSATSEEDSFGLVGLSTIGPAVVLLFFALITRIDGSGATSDVASSMTTINWPDLIKTTSIEVLQAISPIVAAFFLFSFTLLKQSKKAIIRMVEGLLYASVGLILFLVGVSGAFMPVGGQIGEIIGSSTFSWALIPIGFFLGAVVVLAEPSVWVLTDQVREVSGGAINKVIVMLFFSIGVSVSLALAMARVLYEIPLFYILGPGYLIAVMLSYFSPPLFTAIAFDSGAVASGPISNSFLLAFTLGASNGFGANPFSSAFGVVALITMTPLITLQLLGLIYKKKQAPQPEGVLQ